MNFKTIRLFLTTVLTLLIGLLVLQALGYGVGFVIDPESGVKEFGYEKPAVVEDLTVALVGLAGVGMLGIAALLILSAILIWRTNPAGAYVAMIAGGVYVLAGLCAFRAEWWWDAGFYTATGALLIILSVAVRWLQGHSSSRGCGASCCLLGLCCTYAAERRRQSRTAVEVVSSSNIARRPRAETAGT